jgi:hypothetical protein
MTGAPRNGRLEGRVAVVTGGGIADTVAFLVSDEAGYIIGQVISPNGGILT